MRCTDGDTAHFLVQGKDERVRFLAIDAPEINTEEGQKAADYACGLLMEAETIELEFDTASNQRDQYDRLLAWIFVDDQLLQLQLVKQGMAQVAYLYGDYRYTSLLKKAERER